MKTVADTSALHNEVGQIPAGGEQLRKPYCAPGFRPLGTFAARTLGVGSKHPDNNNTSAPGTFSPPG